MIGKTLSHYKILDKLGEGGMGVVYKAQDTTLDRLVALKFLPHHLTANEAEKARFIQEAKAAAILNHPNICTIHAIEEADGQQFIVMEYIDGSTLREKVPLQKIQDVLTYAIQIGDAVQEAHSKGIVHRDIKADNVMVDQKGQIRVMDFGLAKLKGSLKLTRSSSTVGTLGYMAPEQIQGGEADTRSDIFSFGVLLYEMLTGHLPFRGEHEAAMVYSIVNESPEPVNKYRQDVFPELIHIINRALEKDPVDRYQAISEIAGELRHLKKQTSRVMRTSSFPSQPLTGAAEVTTGPPKEVSSKGTGPFKSHKIWLAIVGALGIIAVGLALFLLMRLGKFSVTPAEMKIARLTSTGKVNNVVISPEERFIVYSQREKGKQSLWVRQIATTSTVQILPPADVSYFGLTLSKDGNYLYYVVQQIGSASSSLYKMPVLGGSAKKLLDDVQSAVSLSPDEKQLTFTRYYRESGEFSLIVANEDGSGDRVLATHKADKWFYGKPSWSPDGGTIVCPLGDWQDGYHYSPVAVSVRDGSERVTTRHQWMEMLQIEWLQDGSGFVVKGIEKGAQALQLWFVRWKDGQVQRITNDLSNYSTVSPSQSSKTLCSIQSETRSSLWIVPGGDVSKSLQITSGKEEGLGRITFTQDGRIIYTNQSGGNQDIWICESDGSNQRQLTSEPSNEYQPAISADGRTIFFVSDRSGIPNIWRMQLDGSKPQQLTFGGEDYFPAASVDGKWLYFSSWDTGPLLVTKIPVEGGEPQIVFPKGASIQPRPSPDGKFLAFFFQEEQQLAKPKILIMPMTGGEPVKSFVLPTTVNISELQWTRDSRGLTYIDERGGISNIWQQPFSGGPARQVTHFTSDQIFYFCWSTDGKELVVARGQTLGDVVLMSNFR